MSVQQNKLVIDLNKAITKFGISRVTKEMGLRSLTTIRNWITMDQVPPIRTEQLREVLRKLK